MTTIRSTLPQGPSRDLNEAKFWNAMLSYCGHPLPLADQNVAVTFEVRDVSTESKPGLLVKFGDAQRAVIAITKFPFQEAFDADLDVEGLRALPVGLRDAINEGIVELLWGALPQHGLGACEILRTGSSDDLAGLLGADLTWLEVTLSGLFADVVTLEVGCHVHRLAEILVQGKLAPRRVWQSLKTRIATDVFITIERMTMSLAQVRGLRHGDVVVFAANRVATCRLRLESVTHVIEQVDAGWVCVETMPLVGNFRKKEIMDEMYESDAVLDNLLISIDFDIGQRRVALSEIESWQKGSLVQIDIPTASPGIEVTVRANGRVLATGDLIRIDERVAVRLNRLLFRSGATD